MLYVIISSLIMGGGHMAAHRRHDISDRAWGVSFCPQAPRRRPAGNDVSIFWRYAGLRQIPLLVCLLTSNFLNGERVDNLSEHNKRIPATEHTEKPRFFRSVRAAPAWKLDTISMRIRSKSARAGREVPCPPLRLFRRKRVTLAAVYRDGTALRFFRRLAGNADGQHAVLVGGTDVIHIRIIR